MKLWQMLYGSMMMNEAGGGEGGGGAATPAGGEGGASNNNAPADMGNADYLNDDPGSQGQQNNGAAATGAEGGEGGDGSAKQEGGDGLSLDDDKGLLNQNPEEAPLSDADYSFDMPEGFDLGDDVKTDLIKIAKENNVKPEVAKQFVEKHIALKQQELATAKETIESWRQATINDPDIGGAYIQQTMKNVNNALSAPGGSEFASILKQTGLQNHPAVVKFLNHYGNIVKNDSVRGGSPANTNATDQAKLDSLYGKD